MGCTINRKYLRALLMRGCEPLEARAFRYNVCGTCDMEAGPYCEKSHCMIWCVHAAYCQTSDVRKLWAAEPVWLLVICPSQVQCMWCVRCAFWADSSHVSGFRFRIVTFFQGPAAHCRPVKPQRRGATRTY